MVRVKDLTDISDKNYQDRQGEYMVCKNCGYTWGGTRGDYWNKGKNYIFTCSSCSSDDMALVKDITTQKVIKV